MRHENVQRVLRYYRCIPEMLRLLHRELRELEDEYYSVGSPSQDGLPRSPSAGRSAETAGLRAARDGAGTRRCEIEENERVLLADQRCIRVSLDALNGEYKELLVMRYVRRYSWAKIGVILGAPESTTRDRHRRAVKRLGEALDAVPDAQGLVDRASRART